MEIKISEITKLSERILQKWGFSVEEAKLITANFIEGELTGKKTHGLVRLVWMKKQIDAGKINVKPGKIEIVKETPVSIMIDGENKPGLYVIQKALDLGIKKAKKSGN
jgi:LDH2 family malate/lactate/ureidoglycolate dehydrogenase